MRTKLRTLRTAYGYTQQKLAATAGISRNHYTQIETGDKNPSFKVAVAIKKQLGYTGDDLFDNVDAADGNFFT